jgi:hypothetical protein
LKWILKFSPNNNSHVNSTLANQLAVCNHVQSLTNGSRFEHYNQFPDAFQFIKDVAIDWSDSKYLEAEPGQYITVARQTKGTNNWFVGNVNGETARTSAINFDFLQKEKNIQPLFMLMLPMHITNKSTSLYNQNGCYQ